jgi:hypothetical protein
MVVLHLSKLFHFGKNAQQIRQLTVMSQTVVVHAILQILTDAKANLQ